MAAAANYGRANRQLLTEATRRVFEQHTATSLDLFYDVSHNLAKIEVHDGRRPRPRRSACTAKARPARCRPAIPTCRPTSRRSANRCSFPARWAPPPTYWPGVPDNPAFFSTAHGAGRVQSRHQAARRTSGEALRRRLEAAGILVRGSSRRGLAEEKPEAYKDIDAVIEISHDAGLARKIARLVPLGVVKG